MCRTVGLKKEKKKKSNKENSRPPDLLHGVPGKRKEKKKLFSLTKIFRMHPLY